MSKFKQRNLQMLVATDVAARGLDVSDLSHVINYNLPEDTAGYTHRSGRTGRAGKSGIALSIVHSREKGKLRQIEKAIGKKMEQLQVPDGNEVCEKQLFHFIDRMEKVDIDHGQIDQFLPDVYTKLERMSKEDVIKRFVALEFNRFLDYYKDAKDLNIVSRGRDRDEDRGKDRDRGRDRDRGDRERGGRDRDRSSAKSSSVDFTRFFINAGSKSGVKPLNIITLINSNVRARGIEIGRIEIEKKFSFFEVDSKHEGEVLRSLNNAFLDGRSVFVEVAQSKSVSGGEGISRERDNDSGGDNFDRRRNSGGNTRRRDTDKKKRRRF